MPKVSIVIPTYNVERYLRECLDSVINQTLKDIEIICVDDGATDNSGKILDEYAAKDNRIKVIHKENGGYGKAMNVGLDNATGEYIGIVEPDDWIEPDMFEVLYDNAVNYNVDCVKSNYLRYSSNKIENNNKPVEAFDKSTVYNRKIEPLKNKIIFRGGASIWSGIYKKEFLNKHNIRLLPTPGASFQDTSFWIKVLFEIKEIVFISYAGYHYRIDNDNSSVKSDTKIFCICDELNELEKRYSGDKAKETIVNSLKLDKYAWNYNRLSDKSKKIFRKRYIAELKNVVKKENFSQEIVYAHNLDTYYRAFYNSIFRKIFSFVKYKNYILINLLFIKIKFRKRK